MKIEIKHRYNASVLFTAEIDADENTPFGIKLGLAIKLAIKSFADLRFADLRSADLSSANLSFADLRSANLSSADLRFADLRFADLSSANLRFADLRLADLSSADLRFADLSSADLSSANLSFADLRSANLSSADLSSANLRSADLSSADLSSADLSFANLPYVEAMPNLDGKILEIINKGGGSLDMSDWHKCETTHCRAGWATTLHPAGKTLESIFGTPAAAALIYNASYPTLKVPDFYTDNETAMVDIKSRAELSATEPK